MAVELSAGSHRVYSHRVYSHRELETAFGGEEMFHMSANSRLLSRIDGIRPQEEIDGCRDMRVDIILLRLATQTAQQLHMQFTFQQAEELRGRAADIRDTQLTARDVRAQIIAEFIFDPLRACLPEQFARMRIASAWDGHHPMHRNSFLAGGKREKRLGDRGDLCFEIALQFVQEQCRGQLVFASGADRGAEQGLFVAEMAVNGEFGHAGFGRDLIHAHAVEAVRREQPFCSFEYRSAFTEILGATGAGRLEIVGIRPSAGVWRGGRNSHDLILD